MTTRQWMQSVLLATALTLSLSACQKEEGPLEKAGKSMDQAVEKAKDVVRPEGTMEKAGKSVDEAIDKAKEAAK